MIPVWILGCASEPPSVAVDPTVSTVPTVPDDAPWVVEDTAAEVAVALDPIVDAVQDAILRAATFDPSPVLDGYRALAADGDAGCPTRFVNDGVAYWLDDCTSDVGTAFSGFGVDDLTVDPASGLTVETIGGVGSISAADGAFVTFDGYVQVASADDGYVRSTTILVAGEFATDAASASGTWVEEGVVPNLVVARYEIGGLGTAAIVTGTLEGLPGGWSVVAFDEATLIEPATGLGDCGDEPAGSISVRTADGSWADIVFDPVVGAEAVETADPAACDGCGQVWHDGVDVGQACFAFDAWR
ncbi:MAG: hypothetical protein ABMB14_08245 [Myxococcota bacterium]